MNSRLIISHRANLDGPDPKTENHPDQITKVLEMGIDVEVDVWNVESDWYLGHDGPEHKVSSEFLKTEGLWIHAKNLKAVEKLSYLDVNWFWHEDDKVTLTSKGNIWCYPGHEVKGGIMVDDGQTTEVKISGICTDYPLVWK
jgi:hypothetical protein